jgi:hypothetical protein
MIRRQASIDFAVDFADRSAELLREAVRPANLDTPSTASRFRATASASRLWRARRQRALPRHGSPPRRRRATAAVTRSSARPSGRRRSDAASIDRQPWGSPSPRATRRLLPLRDPRPSRAANRLQGPPRSRRMARGRRNFRPGPAQGRRRRAHPHEEPPSSPVACPPCARRRPGPHPRPRPFRRTPTQSAEHIGEGTEDSPAEETPEEEAPESEEAEAEAESEGEAEDGEVAGEESARLSPQTGTKREEAAKTEAAEMMISTKSSSPGARRGRRGFALIFAISVLALLMTFLIAAQSSVLSSIH